MSDTAVLVVDMRNTYQHSNAELLVPNIEKIIEPLTQLVRNARESDDIDLVYVNDNYGDFTAQFSDIVNAALDGASAFYSTPLACLLGRLDTKRVILTGQVTEQCILYIALDADVCHLMVAIPCDAVAPIDAELRDTALKIMERNMDTEVTVAADCLG